MNKNSPQALANLIKQRVPNFRAKVGIVLGSGLGHFADYLSDAVTIPYSDLPGFPIPTVKGHQGNLVLGYLSGVGVVCLQGRAHAYEGASSELVKTYVRTLKCLGCEYFIATNASGSLREEVGPGELMLITDHINFQPSPLIGPNDEEYGPRFLPVDAIYNEHMRHTFLTIAKREQINLHEGTYIAVLGPNYETAAEIRAFRILGADAVGMSTVPEVLIAHHCGMKVAVIAIITNYATGLSTCAHDHDEVVKTASTAAQKLAHLIHQFVAETPL